MEGRPEEGINLIQQAMELNPFHLPRFWGHLGRAYFTGQRYAESIIAIEQIDRPNEMQLAFIASSQALIDDNEKASETVLLVLGQNESLTVKDLMAILK